MHLILAHLTSDRGDVIATLGPLDPEEHANWFANLNPDLQQRTTTELVPVHEVDVGPYLDELWGGWLVTCYDANNDIVLRRRFNDKHVAEAHAASIQAA